MVDFGHPLMANARVVHVRGPITLDFGHGIQLQITPIHGPTSAAGRRGRKPSPATAALIAALQADAAAGKPRTRKEYLEVLHKAGHKGGPASAGIILRREAKRILGKPVPRRAKAAAEGRGAGRKPAWVTVQLREKLEHDKSNGGVKDAKHYVRWLADHANVGLRRARPVVYRELRKYR